jgi:glycosyltransferase involved in cell wall biosynthesis
MKACFKKMVNDHHRPLRIALLSYRNNPHCGGQGVYVRHLSSALKKRGHRVQIIAGPPAVGNTNGVPIHHLQSLDLYDPADPFRVPQLRELAHPLNLWEWISVSTMGFPEPFLFGLRAYHYLRRRLSQFDIVHDNQSLSYGIWALQNLIPTVATVHHPISIDRNLAIKAESIFWRKAQLMRWYSMVGMQKRVTRRLKLMITVSQRARKDIVEAFGSAADRFRIVPNGIDTNLFRPFVGIDRIPNRLIVTTSADTPLKGLGYLLKAIACASASHPIELIVIGALQKNGFTERLLRSLGIAARVRFTGRVSDAELVRQYAKASIAVIPSVYEGFGLPAGEAMACGVPVIGTTGGALPEVIGDTGLLVPPANAKALTRAILKLLENPSLAAKLGQKGYHRIQHHFTWDQAARQTVAVYREAIDGHGRF